MGRQDEHLSVEDWWDERPISKHRADVGGFFGHTWAFFLLAAFAAGFGCIGFFVPAQEGPMVGIIIGCIAVPLAIGLVVFGIWRWVMLIKHVDLHEGGLVWNDGSKQMAGWDDIKDFYRAEVIVNGAVNRREITITTHDGHTATFTYALSDWKELADRAQYEITIRKVPEAVTIYQAGEKVRFGKEVAISLEGITLDGMMYSWDRVRGARLHNGYITVTTSGGEEHPMAVGDTPNFPVLLKLLEISPAGLSLA
jgi:hypothetical protein